MFDESQPRDEDGKFASTGAVRGHISLKGKSETAKVTFAADELKLPKEEAKKVAQAAASYTGQNGATVNTKIRLGKELTPREQNIKDGTDEYLKNAPKFPNSTVVFRGFQVGSIDNLKPGIVLPARGFFSTSSNEKVSRDFAHPANGNHGVIVQIEHHHSGVSVQHFSRFENEQEVLFPRGSRFKVTSVETKGNLTYLHAEQIESKTPESIHIKMSFDTIKDGWEGA